ncbi:MAG: hypothetical protein K0S11_763, partial [Gammaproteobacteria bacterium]|nr:hypothetical protein [Gammaproteobacteria bacterium]
PPPPPHQTLFPYTTLFRSNDGGIFTVAILLSILNGYLYFEPGKNALASLLNAMKDILAQVNLEIPNEFFQSKAVKNFNTYVGFSGLIANTLLAIETLMQLLHHRHPVAYENNIKPKFSAIFKETLYNFGKNIKANFFSTLVKLLLTGACLTVIIPFSFQQLQKIFAGDKHPTHYKSLNILLALFSNVVAAAIYGNGWRNAPDKYKKAKMENNAIHLWHDHLTTLFNLLTAVDYKRELVKAYNKFVVTSFFGPHASTNITRLLDILITSNPNSAYKHLNDRIKEADIDKNIKTLLKNAKNLNINLLKETARDKLQVTLPVEELEPTHFIYRIFELDKQNFPDYHQFYKNFFTNYFELVREKLLQMAPEDRQAVIRNMQFTSLDIRDDDRLLTNSASYEEVFAKIKILPDKDLKQLIEFLLSNNGLLTRSAVQKFRRATTLLVGAMTGLPTAAAGLVAGKGLVQALLGPGHRTLEIISGLVFGIAAPVGRGGIFSFSLTRLVDHFVITVPYNLKKLCQDAITLWVAIGDIVRCRFSEETSSAIISIGYISFQLGFYYLSTLMSIVFSPLGVAGVSATALKYLGGFFEYLILPGIVIAFVGGLAVNFSSALHFAQKISNLLVEFFDTVLKPFLNKVLHSCGLDFTSDRQYYWESVRFLEKEASKFIKAFDAALKEAKDSEASLTNSLSPLTTPISEEQIVLKEEDHLLRP